MFLWWDLGILVLAIIPHEIGHWIGYRICGYKPDIKFKWWGAILLGTNVFFKMKIKDAVVTTELGILFGYIFVFLMTLHRKDAFLELAYLFSCLIDINHLINFIGEDKNMTIVELYRKNMAQVEELVAK